MINHVCEYKIGVAGTSVSAGLLGFSAMSLNEILTTISLLISIVAGVLTSIHLARRLKSQKADED